ncbi:MAG: 3-phosphoshikimate 1-carboxyvinyltransferase [Thiotrichales bacterium]|nr:3-phosphoshikimate 1-carboxyvinyltransferase [Thiotrichales bacterium]
MSSGKLKFTVNPGSQLLGAIRVPGDKSISHRSIMLGALAEGVTKVSGFLEGEDSLATLQAFREMGVSIDGPVAGEVSIHGVGMGGLSQPVGDLYLGNSGTSMRLLSGLLSGAAKFELVLSGDESLSSRPMRRVTDPLQSMGAEIASEDDGTAPLKISKSDHLSGVEYEMPMASAQVKSSLLLAGIYAQGETCVTEPAPTRDHTERMLQGFGYEVRRENFGDGESKVCLTGGGSLNAVAVDVPADISSAAFFLVGASIAQGSDLLLEHVGINPTRIGVINILREMGADIELLNETISGGEPVADLRVKYAPLHGIEIPLEQVPLAIDEFPVLFVAAAVADGQTLLSGAEELRVKESDRIQVMADGLAILGVEVEVTPDGIIIEGGDSFSGGTVESHGDHRISMSFAIAALRATAEIEILDCDNVNTSFPGFSQLASSVGLKIRES